LNLIPPQLAAPRPLAFKGRCPLTLPIWGSPKPPVSVIFIVSIIFIDLLKNTPSKYKGDYKYNSLNIRESRLYYDWLSLEIPTSTGHDRWKERFTYNKIGQNSTKIGRERYNVFIHTRPNDPNKDQRWRGQKKHNEDDNDNDNDNDNNNNNNNNNDNDNDDDDDDDET